MSEPGRHASVGNRRALRIEAPARLHLGFIDVSATLGRRFGSLGLAIEELVTTLTVRTADEFAATGPQAQRADAHLRHLLDEFGMPDKVALHVERAIPEHAGLGSGTQLALATGRALCRLLDVHLSTPALAERLDRGARSGIGIGTFEAGGFVVDGGRGTGGGPPPIVARLEFPRSWRLLLVFDSQRRGLFGEAERAAFRALESFPQAKAAHLAHLTLMRLLPALAESDFVPFGEALGEIQRAVGDHFAPAQGGRFTSPRVAAVLQWLEAQGIAGVGQASWGPTGFGVIDSHARAQALLIEARSRFRAEGVDLLVVSGRNRGHREELLEGFREAGLPSLAWSRSSGAVGRANGMR
jgi:beta-RFAP synthase